VTVILTFLDGSNCKFEDVMEVRDLGDHWLLLKPKTRYRLMKHAVVMVTEVIS
jgi:hypothetical protein